MPTASALNLIIDITNPSKEGIIQSFQNRLPATAPLLIRNDVETVSLRFVQPAAGTSRPWDDVDYTAAATYMALGQFDVAPTSGTNTFQFGPRTVGNLNSTTTVAITGSVAGIVNGMKVSGSGIVQGTTCTISGSTVTLSQAATTTDTGVDLYFYNETAGVAAGASAGTVSTAVNALASVIAAGGVAITNPENGVYLATLTVAGVTPGYFSGSPTGLNPVSTILVSEVVAGAAGIQSQQLIEIFANPYALNATWTPFPSASADFTTLSAGSTATPTGTLSSGSNTITAVSSLVGVTAGQSITGTGIPSGTTVLSAVSTTIVMSQNATASGSGVTLTITSPCVQLLTITPGAYDGSFQITTPLITTSAIAIPLGGTTAQSIQTALNALGSAYSVTGNAGGPFSISIAGAAVPYTANATGIIVPIGLTGTMNLSTYPMWQAFIAADLDEITLQCEVQVTPSGGGQSTPLLIPVQVSKNVINLSRLVPAPTVAYYTQAQVDAAIAAAVAALTDIGTTLTVSGAGTQTDGLSAGNIERATFVTVVAFSGTAAISVLAANARAGTLQTYIITFPALSTGVTLNITDDAGSTVLAAVVGTTIASISVVDLIFDGANWLLLRWA